MIRSSGLRRWRDACLMLLAFVAGCMMIRSLVPEPRVPYVSNKLAGLEQIQDQVTVLFVGSSRIYRHLSPAVFEATLAEHGFEERAFNLGVPGAHVAEKWHMLRRLHRLRLEALKWVFIEPDGMAFVGAAKNMTTRRMLGWHQPAETRLALHSVWATEDGYTSRVRHTWIHVSCFFFNRANLGRLQRVVDDWSGAGSNQVVPSPYLGPEGDGFDPLINAGNSDLERRRELMEDLPEYRRRVRRLARRRRQGNPGHLDAYREEVLRSLVTEVRALGAEPVFVRSPDLDVKWPIVEARIRGVIPELIDCDDPAAYPELYLIRHRFDRFHLNRRGAELYTRIVAERFARLRLAAQDGAP